MPKKFKIVNEPEENRTLKAATGQVGKIGESAVEWHFERLGTNWNSNLDCEAVYEGLGVSR